MSARSRSPGRRGREPPRVAASPIDRDHTSGQIQDIFAIVKKLRDEKASLELQLKSISEHTEADEKRAIRELHKSTGDLNEICELFRAAVEGIDSKTCHEIPELPEAAVAKVVPRGLRSLINEREFDPNFHPATAGKDIAEEVQNARCAVNVTIQEYERVSESAKGLLWDVERLNMIIAAYEQDLTLLKDSSALVKAEINAARLLWRTKYFACRRWQDFTRRSHVLKFQEKLDNIQDEFDLEQAERERELEALMESLGALRAKDNRVKLTLFLKKMKNAAKYKIWRGWALHHKMCQEEKLGMDLDALSKMEQEKLRAMKDKETAAMLRCFIKRWQNRKLAIPFMTWADVVIAKREARLAEELERQRLALLQKIQAMEGSMVANKLKLHFARIAGKMKELTFRALHQHMQMQRIARLGDDGRFKRLKVHLEAKLKGMKFSTFKCLEREARQLKAARIKNNDMAKRVGAFLEMKIKGVKYAIFSAFKRHAKDGAMDDAEAKRLAELIAARDSASMQRLKIFLQGKEMRLKYAAFSWWAKLQSGGAQMKMEADLASKQKVRKALQDQLAKLERELGVGGGNIEAQLDQAQARLDAAKRRGEQLEGDVSNARQRLKDTERALLNEQETRRTDKQTKAKLLDEIEKAKADRDGLEAELEMIVDQIGFLSEYSK